MRPESGASNPRINFSTVDFPEPLAPMKIFVKPGNSLKLMPSRTTLSSNARRTSSNTMIGLVARAPLGWASERVGIGLHQKKTDSKSCEAKKSIAMTPTEAATTALVVDRPDALGAAASAQAHMTADGHDDESQEQRFEDAHPHILEEQAVHDGGPVQTRRHLQPLR